ncbi:MAG TPA: 30S ribosomal protein S12 methylthiotransferase RimO [Propioniciclava tarda]|nr:30S ribosomal protein S12 methylthiotransferase RimO [Propioniciclava tarda]HQD59684.1 30S ribosomal protein S12 methylthiotransferase RimO [Propioniciclava tarda]
MTAATTVHIVSLGCARNEVDSDELAGRLEAGGFVLVDEPSDAEAIVVNTCGFIESAKKDSIDTLLAASDLKGGTTRRVVAVGCMAERYGAELADALPEADAVLGFDAYADIDARLRRIMAGEHLDSHVPTDRRRLLPLAPSGRQRAASDVVVPGLFQPQLLEPTDDLPDLPSVAAPASGPRPVRRRLSPGPSAPVKIASGCDRRCTFCAIPSFRGSFVSRPVEDVVAEVRALAAQGVREAFLVSENSTSYGKDLRDLDALPRLLRELSAIDELEWIRVSYLQPAEVRPGLLEAMCSTPKVVPYFDLSFQHASTPVLRRMRRYGSPEQFLGLLERIRTLAPNAGVRSNVIVGFPGETDADVQTLVDFVSEARLDALGVFAYSDEEGTEGVALPDHVDDDVIAERYERLSTLANDLVEARADERMGERVQVLIEGRDERGAVGRAEHQGPEVDGSVSIEDAAGRLAVGELVWGRVTATDGADLIVERER